MSLPHFDRNDIRLIGNLCMMNLRDRYLGSILGIYWAVLNPLIQLATYTFVFGFIFKARVSGAETTFGFSIWMISGLVPWLAVSEGLSVATSSVVSGSGMVKNIVFKTECLPISSALMGLVPLAVGMIFLFALLCIDGNFPSIHFLALPLVIVVQLAFLIGLGFFLSAMTVFIRDTAPLLTSILMLVLFFTPIFYAREMMPLMIQKITFFNPFYHLIQFYRDILLDHRWPDLFGLGYFVFLTFVLNLFGLKFFQRLKGYFEVAL